MDVDSGREVRFDGELGNGAVAYFDEVSLNRDPKVVVNWYVTCHIHTSARRLIPQQDNT